MEPKRNDPDLNDDMSKIEKYITYLNNTLIERQFPVEILQKVDPRYLCKASIDEILL